MKRWQYLCHCNIDNKVAQVRKKEVKPKDSYFIEQKSNNKRISFCLKHPNQFGEAFLPLKICKIIHLY